MLYNNRCACSQTKQHLQLIMLPRAVFSLAVKPLARNGKPWVCLVSEMNKHLSVLRTILSHDTKHKIHSLAWLLLQLNTHKSAQTSCEEIKYWPLFVQDFVAMHLETFLFQAGVKWYHSPNVRDLSCRVYNECKVLVRNAGLTLLGASDSCWPESRWWMPVCTRGHGYTGWHGSVHQGLFTVIAPHPASRLFSRGETARESSRNSCGRF